MFERTLEMIDETLLEKIKKTKVLLVGVGGVGTFALECLIRLGIENITIIDNDIFTESNLNRQLFANTKNLGQEKVEVAKNRALEINPEVQIKTYSLFLDKETIDTPFTKKYDYIIDACDTITTKLLLIKKAKEKMSKIISCMGMGNRFDPSLVCIGKLKETKNDPIAKIMRKRLKENNITLDIPVIWSKEIPKKTPNRTPASLIFTPASAGIKAAYYILEDLKKDA